MPNASTEVSKLERYFHLRSLYQHNKIQTVFASVTITNVVTFHKETAEFLPSCVSKETIMSKIRI